jgi:hypothetical protein
MPHFELRARWFMLAKSTYRERVVCPREIGGAAAGSLDAAPKGDCSELISVVMIRAPVMPNGRAAATMTASGMCPVLSGRRSPKPGIAGRALSRSRSTVCESERLFDDGRELPRAVRGVTHQSPGYVPVRTYQDAAGALHLPA